jgi:type II secretory pathway component PulF
MSRNSLAADREVRDFVGHQLALEIDGGSSAKAAAEKIRGALAPENHWAVDEALRVLGGEPPPSAWPQLGNVLATARANGMNVDRVFSAYERSVEQARGRYAGVFTGAMSLGIYLVMLATLFLLVIGVYSILVLPGFQAMFAQFGAPLPAFTSVMIGNIAVLAPLLILLVLALVSYLVGLARLKRRMQQMQPVSPGISWVPGLGSWARAHDAALWMRFYALFLDSGVPENVAAHAAEQLTGKPTRDRRPRLLESAAKLGHLRAEIARMLDADEREAAASFERARNTTVLLLRLYIYLLLSGYVLAMYLPIFKLGAVV